VLLQPSEYLAHLAADGRALARAAAVDLSAPVPSCPGWDVAELVRHTGQVHRHKAAIIRIGGTQRPDVEWPPPGAPDGHEHLLAWYEEGLDDVLGVLNTDPETPSYSWAGDHRVAFWQRRMAQETVVHRWDGEAAVDAVTPVDPLLAADGVDELLRVFATHTDEPYEGPDGSIAFAASDTGHTWTVQVLAGELTFDADDGSAAARVEGDADDLLLALWRRRPLTAVTITGDEHLAMTFLAWIDET